MPSGSQSGKLKSTTLILLKQLLIATGFLDEDRFRYRELTRLELHKVAKQAIQLETERQRRKEG